MTNEMKKIFLKNSYVLKTEPIIELVKSSF